MKILRLENIVKYYGKGENITKAVDDVSFSLEKGEFAAIMGPSGSGKSTLLNMIATIDQPTFGEIYIGKTEITKLTGKALSKFRRDELGFVFQDFQLLDTLTGFENIALTLSIQNCSTKEIEKRVLQIARELQIENVLKKYPNQMSGGEKQRVAAARALVGRPKLILADEPTGALDSKSSRLFLEQINTLNREKEATILMVTHDAFTASYANRVIFIKDGKIFHEIFRKGVSRQVFFDQILYITGLLGGVL